MHRDDDEADQAETIGQPLPQVEVKIADPETLDVLPLGAQGEICVRGYQTMIGYFNMPEATAATLTSDGWLRSGDLGSMDERGFLRITGRIKDMIIRGGENIYPREVENLLLEDPRVSLAAVIGAPDPVLGEIVCAVIQPKDPANPPQPAELHAFCRSSSPPTRRQTLVLRQRIPIHRDGQAPEVQARRGDPQRRDQPRCAYVSNNPLGRPRWGRAPNGDPPPFPASRTGASSR